MAFLVFCFSFFFFCFYIFHFHCCVSHQVHYRKELFYFTVSTECRLHNGFPFICSRFTISADLIRVSRRCSFCSTLLFFCVSNRYMSRLWWIFIVSVCVWMWMRCVFHHHNPIHCHLNYADFFLLNFPIFCWCLSFNLYIQMLRNRENNKMVKNSSSLPRTWHLTNMNKHTM